jgi:2-keto-4-pentenoate hydratase
VQRQLGLPGPVVGYLTSATQVEPGATHSLAGTTRPAVEAEVAIHLGAAVPGDATADEARAAIAGLGPAIEVIDADLPLEDVYAILAGNVFHRAFVLGPVDSDRTSIEDVSATVKRGDSEEATAEAASAMNDPAEVVRYVAGFLADHGGTLEAGECIIAGSLAPPVAVEPGDRIAVDVSPLGELTVGFS